MDDAEIADVADFGAPAEGESGSPAWSEGSDGHGARGGAQQLREDITGAALPPELVAAARSEE
eukprot:13776299-Alexandrium_andersonii.AAC.1